MAPYILCANCKKPLIIEENVRIFRRRMIAYITGGTLFGGILGAAALPLLGFGLGGVAAGSTAAAWQSSLGLVAAGSTFALLQSLGATGMGILLFGSIGAVTGGGALGLIHQYAKLFNWCQCDKPLRQDEKK